MTTTVLISGVVTLNDSESGGLADAVKLAGGVDVEAFLLAMGEQGFLELAASQVEAVAKAFHLVAQCFDALVGFLQRVGVGRVVLVD